MEDNMVQIKKEDKRKEKKIILVIIQIKWESDQYNVNDKRSKLNKKRMTTKEQI